MTSDNSRVSMIVGTAGHIDHGKTALVRALTGTDTDRLPEEKRRGITIELGFAELELAEFRLGIVDVPGHERFVRQMLAGATGMDLAMLVVAADDSVKPQTREHLDVLRFLNLRGGVIVLTKCDLPDPDWIELVEAEVRELVEGTPLAGATIVRTSATTGLGIDSLKQELVRVARAVQRQEIESGTPFRMPIDRIFSIEGHGTVVTGSVTGGSLQVGDTVVIQPLGIETRVRQLQNHDRPVERVSRGERAALNLAGVHPDQLVRGHELASPGHLIPSRRLIVSIQLLPQHAWPLRHRARVRLHLGTAEIPATVDMLGQGEIKPGDSQVIQLVLAEPAVAVWGQPLVLRRESPVATLGGGRVLVPNPPRLRTINSAEHELLHDLEGTDERARTAAALYFAAQSLWQPSDLIRLAGISSMDDTLVALKGFGVLVETPTGPNRTVLIHREVLRGWQERITAFLTRFHDHNPLSTLVDRKTVAQAFAYLGDAGKVQSMLESMAASGTVRITERGVGLRDRQPKLSANQQKLLAVLIGRFAEAGLQAPMLADLQKEFLPHAKEVEKLLQLGVADGSLVRVSKDLFLHTLTDRQIRTQLAAAFADRPTMTVSDIRELLGTSRKYAIPLCEHLDSIGWTVRNGDSRSLATGAASDL